MNIERANEIADGIEVVLTSPEPVGGEFTPISRTGAVTRFEIAHALYIVTAQVFKAVSVSPGRTAEFAAFARAAGGSLAHVLWLRPCLPDPELHLIATLQNDTEEFFTESRRLRELAENDGTMQMETIDSFVSYIRTLNPDAIDYWPKVYQRIGLDCPVELDSGPMLACNKPWWRFW